MPPGPLPSWVGQVGEMRVGSLIFRSNFNSGNCALVEKVVIDPASPPDPREYEREDVQHLMPPPKPAKAGTPTEETPQGDGAAKGSAAGAHSSTDQLCDVYQVWVAPDCAGTEYATHNRSWFSFTIEGGRAGEAICLRIMNTNPHQKLFDMDMRPVYKCVPSSPEWARVPHRVTHLTVAGHGVITIPFTFPADGDVVHVAFTFPYSYEDLESALSMWSSKAAEHNAGQENPDHHIFFKREHAAMTLDRLPVDRLTISSMAQHDSSQPFGFRSKSFVFLSARVHPCETPASHILHGVIDFLLSDSDDAAALRDQFVFVILPMLNPDGVSRGYCRTDSLGRNLNRHYQDPTEETPTIALAKNTFMELHRTGRLVYFVDFHAHHSKRGCFFYGNAHDDIEKQVDTRLFPKLISLITPHFDYTACNFSKENMTAKDVRNESKSGSARVALYEASALHRTYTLECNFNTSNIASCGELQMEAVEGHRAAAPKYTPPLLQGIGEAIARATLHLFGAPRCASTPDFLVRHGFKQIDDVRRALEGDLSKKKKEAPRKGSMRKRLDPAFVKANYQPKGGVMLL